MNLRRGVRGEMIITLLSCKPKQLMPITLTIVVCSCSVLYLLDSIDRLSFCFIKK